jgi:uncharacterized membrane protein
MTHLEPLHKSVAIATESALELIIRSKAALVAFMLAGTSIITLLLSFSIPPLPWKFDADRHALINSSYLLSSDIQSFGGGSSPASWTFCNQSSEDRIRLAVAFRKNNILTIDGWYGISRNSCVTPISTNRPTTLYYFAQSKDGRYEWRGNDNNWCIDNASPFAARYNYVTGSWSGSCSRRAKFLRIDKTNAGPVTTIIRD